MFNKGVAIVHDSFDDLMLAVSPNEQALLMDELHRVAKRYMYNEHAGHTLQATALVNEAYVKLAGKSVEITNNNHFIALAARQMRRILVDHARQKLTDKRETPALQITLAEVSGKDDEIVELIHVDQLLKKLDSFDTRAAHVYELRLFSALTNDEIALVLNMSVATVERDAKIAKAWIKSELEQPNN
jgi:RNA polymerase sigma factor (TIGR02999 family)